MIKVRIQFKRGEELRFLSHLDQQRLFNRALRRAQLPIAFSHGFNPHPILSFANAMSVGMTSDCEYVDIGLDLEDDDEQWTAKKIKKQLSSVMPKGITITDAKLIPQDSKALAKQIAYADYDITCLGLHVSDIGDFVESLEQFENLDEIIIEKKNKKGKLVKKDIRECFETITTEKNGKDVIFHIRMIPISGSLLGPETVIQNFLNSVNYYNKSVRMITHRSDLVLSE